jgi:carboxyl-terminal processing protease
MGIMSPRTRFFVLSISTPVLVFAVLGGFLGRASGGVQETYQHLRLFEDVVSLVTNNYVEEVKPDLIMEGAMRGLADGLDADSSYLPPDEVKQFENTPTPPAGGIGLELTRQYYLRVVASVDGSPAAKAGLVTGDYIRAIDGTSTRDMSLFSGRRRLRGAPGSKVTLTVLRGSAAEPHDVVLIREKDAPPAVTGRMGAPGIGYVRISSFGPRTASDLKAQIGRLGQQGATKLIIDLRRTAAGSLDDGIEASRLFVKSGTLAIRESRDAREPIEATAAGETAPSQEIVILTTTGTSGAAELFAAALAGNKRAELIGEHTLGRAALQKLVKLPDGSALWLSWAKYLTPDGQPIHGKGLEPAIEVDEPEVEFGAAQPTTDPILDKALERLSLKTAA